MRDIVDIYLDPLSAVFSHTNARDFVVDREVGAVRVFESTYCVLPTPNLLLGEVGQTTLHWLIRTSSWV